MKRKILTVTIILALCFISSGALAAPGDSKSEPIMIETADGLNAIRNALDKHYKLSNDIDLSAYIPLAGEGWLPIGDSENPFTGGFDGDGRKITGLWIKRVNSDDVGLFGCTSEATIENLGVEIAAAGIEGNYFVGGLVGKLEAKEGFSNIDNCYVKGSIKGDTRVGGLVGIQYALTSGDLSGDITISNCYATGVVIGNDFAGGLVGDQNKAGRDARIINCYARSTVSCDVYAGGLVGHSNGIIEDCYSTSNVNGYFGAGGLVGSSSNRISNCYATGNVNGIYSVGGLIGEMESSSQMSRCYATGNVNGVMNIGMLVGYKLGNMSGCFRYLVALLNGSPVSTRDADSSPARKHGDVENASRLMSKIMYTDIGWLFNDSATAGPWYWDNQGFPKLNIGTEGFPFDFTYSAPEITLSVQPVRNTSVDEGGASGSLSVTASVTGGGTLTYQWYSSYIDLNIGGNPITGAASAIFTIPASLIEGIYYFYCVLSSSGAAPLHSDVAIVEVTKALTGVTGVKVTPETAFIEVNKTQQLNVVVTPESATDKSVTWSTSNALVASVDTSGLVTGMSAGTATITAKSNNNTNVTDTCFVTVTSITIGVTGVTVSPQTITLPVNGSQMLSVVVTPENATDKRVSWNSDNNSVATVDSSGTVTAVSAGTTTITARSVNNTNVTGTCTVTVTPITIGVTGVTISPKPITTTPGFAHTLTANVTPDNATDKSIEWSSDNTAVATVNSSGTVMAVSAGTATITARSNNNPNAADTCSVTVTPEKIEVTGVTITPAAVTITVGETRPLSVVVTPGNATDRSVTWATDNPGVVEVSSAGVVRGVSEGTTTIIAISNSNPNVTGTREVTVTTDTTPVTGVIIRPNNTTITKIGDSVKLVADITPENAINKSVTWSSSNEAVATINQGGWVTAVSAGKTTITAISNSNTSITNTCEVTVSSQGGGDGGGCNVGFFMSLSLFVVAPLVLGKNRNLRK